MGHFVSRWIPSAWTSNWDKLLPTEKLGQAGSPLALRTLTLQAEVPSRPRQGPREASAEGRLPAVPQHRLVQELGALGSPVRGPQDQLSGKDTELEENSGRVKGSRQALHMGGNESGFQRRELVHVQILHGLLGGHTCQRPRSQMLPNDQHLAERGKKEEAEGQRSVTTRRWHIPMERQPP